MTSPRDPSASVWRGVLSLRLLFIVCAAVVIGLAIVRQANGGWESMDADHARYVYAGMSLLDGRGYVNEVGEAYYIRAPAYPLIVGGAYSLAGPDGAHLAAWCLGLSSLLLAIALAWRLGGVAAALMTTATTFALPQFWEQLVSLGIDLPQAAFYLAVVVLLLWPKPGYWLAAGGLFGLALLIKETAAPAAILLPIAWLPPWSGLTWRRWTWLAGLFLGAVAVVAGWWWFLVWWKTGYVFPLNALRSIVPDDATAAASVSPGAVAAGLVAVAGWVYLLYTRFREVGVRLLAFAALGLAPAVAATIVLAQPARNFTGVLLLSCVAVGVAIPEGLRAIASRTSVWGRRAISAVVAVALVASIALGQQAVVSTPPDLLPVRTAALLRPGLEPGQEVVSSFRYRSALGVELFNEHVAIRLLPVKSIEAPGDPSQYLWLGDRRGTLFGLTRDDWRRVMGRPHAAYLVMIAPHPLSPAELLSALRSSDGRNAGLTSVDRLEGPSGTADVFQIKPDLVGQAKVIHLHAAPLALVHWLNIAQAASVSDPTGALIEARPIVPARGEELATLAQRLGPGACFRPRREGGSDVLLIVPALGQTDCLTTTELAG